jgi:hypothetical protein
LNIEPRANIEVGADFVSGTDWIDGKKGGESYDKRLVGATTLGLKASRNLVIGAEAGNLRASDHCKFKPNKHFQPVQIEHFHAPDRSTP